MVSCSLSVYRETASTLHNSCEDIIRDPGPGTVASIWHILARVLILPEAWEAQSGYQKRENPKGQGFSMGINAVRYESDLWSQGQRGCLVIVTIRLENQD